MLWINLIVAAVALGADWWLWKQRIAASRMGRRARVALLVFWILPLLWPASAYLIEKCTPDNTIALSRACTEVELLFMLIVPTLALLHIGLATERRWLRYGALLAAVVTVATLLSGYRTGSRQLRIEEVEIASPRLPRGFDSVRLVHLSDLHVGALHHPADDCRKLVERVAELAPDMILFTGDLVHIRYSELNDEVMEELSRLRAPLGVWSVVGNHDTGVYIRDSIALPHDEHLRRLIARQEAMGWCVLSDQSRLISRQSDTISLSGIAFPSSLRNFRHKRHMPDDYHFEATYEGVSNTHYNLTLCHLPQLFDPIIGLGYGDLVLSGHVHSMQHKLPIGRRGWSLSRLKYRRWSGLYREGDRALYINDGIASVGIPVRIGTRPEITLITLRRAE